jgi:hypothetical protein
MYFFVLMLSVLFRPEDYFGYKNQYGDRYRVRKTEPGLPVQLGNSE